MANANPSRIGQINLAGATDSVFLKVFGGEVLTAFWAQNLFSSKVMVRTITSGKSAQFPAIGTGTAAYHTPGTEIVGDLLAGAERVIAIDQLLVASKFIANIDEAMAHFDVRGPYSSDVGRALAAQWDKNTAQTIALAARAATTVTGGSGGTRVVNATAKTNIDSFVQSVFDAQTALDQKNVPQEDRFLAVDPGTYYKLVNSTSKAINRDYNPDGNGSVGSGVIFRVAGLPIVKSNYVPSTNVTTGPATYQGDFSALAGLVWQKGAVGTVKLMDLAVEMAYDIRRQGTLIVGKYAVGHGILRPECAVEIATV